MTEKVWEYKGYTCVVKEHPRMGHYLGYVGVPEDHVAAVIGDYEDIPVPVHGGLTFSGEDLQGVSKESGFWVGWDYAHIFDQGKDYSLEDIVEDVEDVVNQLSEIGIADAVEEKLEFMPEWFRDNIEVSE